MKDQHILSSILFILGCTSFHLSTSYSFTTTSNSRNLFQHSNHGSTSFTYTSPQPFHQPYTSSSSSSSLSSSSTRNTKTQLNMVVDRLSDECVAAITVSHKLGNEMGLRVLRIEPLLSGITNRPEKAGRTLAKYNLQYPLVKQSAIRELNANGFQLARKVNKDTLMNKDKPLPFSEETKMVLTSASKIADKFDSPNIHSEHVLLALMGYNYGKPMDMENLPSATRVFIGTEGIALPSSKPRFSAYEFCEELVEDMALPYDLRDNPITEEVVVIGGGSASTNTLDDVGVDLTQMALEGKLDLVHGRSNEINMALRTLGRRRKNNPVMTGDPGVGKTAIAEAIAQVLASSYPEDQKKKFQKNKDGNNNGFLSKINPFKKGGESEGESKSGGDTMQSTEEQLSSQYQPTMEEQSGLPPCPNALTGFRLISIELASLVAGTRNRGDFEEKVQNLIREASNTNIILFIDEIHNLIGTGGGGDGAMNAANLMKPALARGEIRVLGATTTMEYRRYIEKDAALERRFQPLDVVEPTPEETNEILKTITPKYAEYHEVEYTEQAVLAATKLSDRYISDRFLPDKAIDLIDEAGSMVKMSPSFEEDYFVTEDAIAQVVSEISGIPVGRLDTGEKTRLRNLELEMGKRIKGQERAVKAVAKAVRRSRSGMRDTKKPVASFLFCGPTGVGKTELCKSLADSYFGREKDLISIDMSEYMDRFSTSRLVGAPPGYVGYEEGGQLTEAVRRNPHSVILLDEIEKAHEDVLNILLQIMDEGKLTDGKGRVVNFKNTIFVMTSNIGSQKILEKSKNFNGDDTTQQSIEMARVVMEELEESWKPELLNRIDEIVVFSPLSYENLLAIASNILEDTAKRAGDAQNIQMEIGDSVISAVTREASIVASQYGARPIKRAVQRYLEDTMSEVIMRDFVKEGDQVLIEMSDAKMINGITISDDQAVVEISKFSPSLGTRDSTLVPVEAQAGIGGAIQNDLEWQALYGDLPSLDDDSSSSPPRESGPSWE